MYDRNERICFGRKVNEQKKKKNLAKNSLSFHKDTNLNKRKHDKFYCQRLKNNLHILNSLTKSFSFSLRSSIEQGKIEAALQHMRYVSRYYKNICKFL